ncbi:MAG: HAMP domain-containing sensor histidine kinase [Bacilli bacterium]|nr:HAMP domain-containing sensor histidine kinase [Bacilli bacterium]
MNICESIILSSIFILFPLFSYLLFELISHMLNNKKQDLFLDFSLISIVYLLIKYSFLMVNEIPFILINIPLTIAYVKKRYLIIASISMILVFYYNNYFDISASLLVLEYGIYYIVGSLFKNKKDLLLLKIFIIVKTIFLSIYLSMNNNLFLNHEYPFITALSLIFLLIVIYQFTIFLFFKTEEIINMHKMINKVEEEKIMYQSLFKITHEIKNPIAVCKGYLDMFDINSKDHSRRYIPILKSEINRLLVLLEDFLSINRIEIKKEIMDLELLIEEVIKNFKPILEDKNIKIEFLEKEEIFIDGDFNRLKQVFVNIIKNSLESISNNGQIKVSYYKKNNNVFVVIEDNGDGMTKEELAGLFQPFFTTKKRGSGLGVYLSKEILKLHNGTIKYKSSKNKGTIVTIKLPIDENLK